MKRSEDQERAFNIFLKWVSDRKGPQEFRLGGLAGTGKTTLIKSMRERMNNCEVIAPTAIAATVLSRKGVNATTCHKLLCNFIREDKDEKGRSVPVFSDKMVIRDFLIVDEASMITSDMRRKILHCAQRVVWVGDYGQLPPVENGWHGDPVLTESNLDAKLFHQHRHDESKAIIEFANYLRSGGLPVNWEDNSDQVIVNPSGVNCLATYCKQQQLWPVLCYKNDTVDSVNNKMREVFNITKPLQFGLKIVCTKNNYRYGVVNGEMFTIANVKGRFVTTTDNKTFPVSFDSNDTSSVVINDGYAITCHKAQGSEWPKIAVIEDKKADPRWRYTAATRAQKTIVYFTID